MAVPTEIGWRAKSAFGRNSIPGETRTKRETWCIAKYASARRMWRLTTSAGSRVVPSAAAVRVEFSEGRWQCSDRHSRSRSPTCATTYPRAHPVLTRFSLGSPVFSLGRPVVLAGCDVSERLCRGVHRGRAVCERVWRGPRYWTVRMVDSLIERFAARHGTGDIDSPRRFSPAIPPTTGFTEDGSTRTRQSRMSARSSGVGSILRTLWISSR